LLLHAPRHFVQVQIFFLFQNRKADLTKNQPTKETENKDPDEFSEVFDEDDVSEINLRDLVSNKSRPFSSVSRGLGSKASLSRPASSVSISDPRSMKSRPSSSELGSNPRWLLRRRSSALPSVTSFCDADLESSDGNMILD